MQLKAGFCKRFTIFNQNLIRVFENTHTRTRKLRGVICEYDFLPDWSKGGKCFTGVWYIVIYLDCHSIVYLIILLITLPVLLTGTRIDSISSYGRPGVFTCIFFLYFPHFKNKWSPWSEQLSYQNSSRSFQSFRPERQTHRAKLHLFTFTISVSLLTNFKMTSQ